MKEKNNSLLESEIRKLLRFYNFYNHNYKDSNKHTNQIVKDMIESLDDPKAKVANRLSLSRIPLGLTIPLTAYFTKNQWAVLGLTGFYAISDFLDGFYSKHIIHHPTKGGTYFDAICDKIGAIELIMPVILQNPALLVNGALETIISAININSTTNGTKVSSTKLGKIKMWPLSLSLICTYMSKTGFKFKNFEITKEEFKTISNILIPITAALEAVNIIEYNNLKNNQENLSEKPKTLKKQKNQR